MKLKKYIAVTGSNGFVVYNLSKVLLDRGYSVFGIFSYPINTLLS